MPAKFLLCLVLNFLQLINKSLKTTYLWILRTSFIDSEDSPIEVLNEYQKEDIKEITTDKKSELAEGMSKGKRIMKLKIKERKTTQGPKYR